MSHSKTAVRSIPESVLYAERMLTFANLNPEVANKASTRLDEYLSFLNRQELKKAGLV